MAARSILVTILSLAGFVLFWQALSWAKADADVLPGPLVVARIAHAEWQSGALALHMGATLARVAAAFALAMSLGLIIGATLGTFGRADRWLGPWLVIFLNIPALVVIVLCYLWIGLNETAAITAVALNKTAMVAVTLREGIRARDPALADMAQVFGMGWLARTRHITLPQLWPYLAASMRNGLAIIWKIVLVVEFLGRGSGVGFKIHLHFQLFDIATVLAYAVSFIAVMLAVEYLLIATLERRATSWRAQ
ncbi:ABC transporter permease [Roseobacter sp. HKCCA0434]|uniref:ABC transporter permease n=1 Tax=Roseobacter sp. HKCCA0434 TaxID=3079297 RepID=UPI002905C5FF|nr:ABC transporter permease subunit [Roseobacter sp. HKCCA0434]